MYRTHRVVDTESGLCSVCGLRDRGGGGRWGGDEGKRKVCAPKMGLSFFGSVQNFIFCPRNIFWFGVGWWFGLGGGGGGGPPDHPPPPADHHIPVLGLFMPHGPPAFVPCPLLLVGAKLALATTADFDFVWSDSGSGAKRDVSIWRPQFRQAGVYSLGDIAVPKHGKRPAIGYAVQANDPTALARPTGFDRVWKDSGMASVCSSAGQWPGTTYPMPPCQLDHLPGGGGGCENSQTTPAATSTTPGTPTTGRR